MEGYHQLMNIVVIGVGYVGLISGLGLSKLNHNVQFLDIDSKNLNLPRWRKKILETLYWLGEAERIKRTQTW